MNFNKDGRKSRLKLPNSIKSKAADLYKYAVQFYKIPPDENISLQEFEQFALDRLTVLRIIEHASVKYTKFSQEYREYIWSQLRNADLASYIWKTSENEISELEYAARRRDHISHFILRLAYCRSDELRRWFIKQEVDLFQYRFQGEESKTPDLLTHNNLYYEPISQSEKLSLSDDLRNSLKNPSDKTDFQYFKVPFQEVLELVGARKVFVKAGLAYVPHSDLASIVGNVFRMQLSQALAIMTRLLPQMEEDDRLLSILKGLNDRYLGQDFGKTLRAGSGEVTPEMIEKLSKSSFPMCMRVIHESMREKHHLKHHGRLVYGLFLKAIGLSLEDALRFFREEFLKGMDLESYEKKGYNYNIRYNYGTEGKKTNYTPYSCTAIITKHAPGPGEVHGCPFRHFDKNILMQRLQAMNISKQKVQEIVDLASHGHYQLACTKQFELVHGREPSQPINHPNFYYEESKKAVDPNSSSMKSSEKSKPNTQRSVVMSSTSQVSEDMDILSQEEEDLLSEYASENMSFG